jgi:hypothetical protein
MPDLPSTTTLAVIDEVRDGREREQSGGRVAARVRDQPTGGRRELGERVVPARRAQPMRTGEVDDHRAGRRVQRGRRFVVQAAEDELGPGRTRLLVRDEAGKGPVAVAGEPRIERARGLPGQRV